MKEAEDKLEEIIHTLSTLMYKAHSVQNNKAERVGQAVDQDMIRHDITQELDNLYQMIMEDE